MTFAEHLTNLNKPLVFSVCTTTAMTTTTIYQLTADCSIITFYSNHVYEVPFNQLIMHIYRRTVNYIIPFDYYYFPVT